MKSKPRLPSRWKQSRSPGMWEVLNSIGPGKGWSVYEAFLREKSKAGDHSFLLAALKGSNLNPAVQAVVVDLITGKLKRPAHRTASEGTELKDWQRVLRVLDKERSGCQRKAAVSETAGELKCGIRTVEKALAEYEDVIAVADPEHLEWLRSLAIKSAT